MSFFMLFQTIGSMKLLTTFEAAMFWFIMKLHMIIQLTFCLETSFVQTYFTLKLSLITVGCLMSMQIIFLRKSSVTSRTHIRFLTCMYSTVNIKIIFTLKTLQANFTLESSFMNILMATKTTSSTKFLFASQAQKLFLFTFFKRSNTI